MQEEGRRGGGYDGEIRWVPVSIAARELGVSAQRVYQLCATGELVSVVYGRTRLVSLRTVRWRAQERGRE